MAANKNLDDLCGLDEKLFILEKQKRSLEEKRARHREIRRLQLELQQASLSTHEDDLDMEDGEPRDEDNEFDDEESTESIHSRPPPRKRRQAPSTSESSRRSESSESFRAKDFTKIQNDLAMCMEYIRNQPGQVPSIESPLSKDIEIARIDRLLKNFGPEWLPQYV